LKMCNCWAKFEIVHDPRWLFTGSCVGSLAIYRHNPTGL